MENYLSGRGVSLDNTTNDGSSFTPYLQPGKHGASSNDQRSDSDVEENFSTEIIYEEKDCPKVEVLSSDGSPRKILIHLPDGKVLEISCIY